MSISQSSLSIAKPESALDQLSQFIEERRRARCPVSNLEEFERDVRRRFAAAEAALIGEEIGRFDINVPVVSIEGVVHRRVLRCEQTYMTAAGAVSVMRSLYSTREDSERAVPVMELRAGIVEGHLTPLAAQHAAWVVAHLTPQEGETMFGRLGAMNPSKSTLDRLPKALSERWEKSRDKFEPKLRAEEKVPKKAVSVGVSLDGVLIPMKDGERQKKREAQGAAGKPTKGPSGYYEASCGTLTLYGAEGDPLSTIRLGRMPEKDKKTLKLQLRDELDAILQQRPDLRVVKIADGPKNNWTFLRSLPNGSKAEEVLDFYHATEHLYDAFVTAYGEASPKCMAEFTKYRHILRHDIHGAEKVIRHLLYLRDKFPRRRKLTTVLKYFRRHRRRMRYESLARRKLAIGSGIVEATCKTLVTQRLKRSGMRWRNEGGQAILTLRALEQSGRFDKAWGMLADTYIKDIGLPKNVIALGVRREK